MDTSLPTGNPGKSIYLVGTWCWKWQWAMKHTEDKKLLAGQRALSTKKESGLGSQYAVDVLTLNKKAGFPEEKQFGSCFFFSAWDTGVKTRWLGPWKPFCNHEASSMETRGQYAKNGKRWKESGVSRTLLNCCTDTGLPPPHGWKHGHLQLKALLMKGCQSYLA